MNDFLIGLTTTAVIISFLEIFKRVDKRLIGSLTLASIAFIYIGFTWADPKSLVMSIGGVALFIALAYLGFQRSFYFIIGGLILHGLWDIVFPFFSSSVPHGYDIFCITIDVLLAVYFVLRIKSIKPATAPI